MLRKIEQWIKSVKREKGFTLIELVIVIAILGVLAAVAVPRYQNYLNDAKANADAMTIRAVQTAMELYNATEGEYPDSVQTLVDADYFAEEPTLNDGVIGFDGNTVYDTVE